MEVPSLKTLLHSQHNDLTDQDLAALADWAGEQKRLTPDAHWKRAYALIREGADTVLRRRASSVPVAIPVASEHSKMNHADCPSPSKEKVIPTP